MKHYQIIEQTKRIINRINIGLPICEHHEIVYYVVKMLLTYPLKDRTEIYKELVNHRDSDAQWYTVMETLQIFPYYTNLILGKNKPYTTTPTG